MNKKSLLKELENLCRNAGFVVRYTSISGIEGTGDHCRVYENKYIVVNGLLRTEERIDALFEIMNELNVNWNDMYILPEIRLMMIKRGLIDDTIEKE